MSHPPPLITNPRTTTVRRPLDAAEAKRRRSTRLGAIICALLLAVACFCGAAIGAVVEHLRIG